MIQETVYIQELTGSIEGTLGLEREHLRVGEKNGQGYGRVTEGEEIRGMRTHKHTTYICTYILHIYVHTYYIYMYIHIHMYVHIYVYTYIYEILT